MPSAAGAQFGTNDGQWKTYGGDKGSTKYAPLDQINQDNFDQLEVAWQWETLDNEVSENNTIRGRAGGFESTPLMIDGVLYTSTSFSQVAAIDAGTGETLWKYDPESWKAGRPANLGFIHRGVSYWEDGDESRIIIATGDSHLIALDPKTGATYSDFGEDGKVDLRNGLNLRPRVSEHQVNSPPIICNNVIVVGSVIFDRPSMQKYVRGDIRGFDPRTGETLWTFHSIPQEGEFGNETWEEDSWKYSGSTNAWSLLSADEELDYVYIPFGAATNDFYGGHRPGDNLFATSLVCLNAKTGERVWHFQTVHHDLWDYDLPCAPNLLDVVVDGKPIKAVMQFSKTGFGYAFDRVTGEPIWPIEERPVPQSTVPGEKTSKTQPFPTKPPPFAHQGLTEKSINDATPEIKAEILKIIEEHGGYTPMFTPPGEKPVIMIPGDGGGANWAGASLDPETSILYVPAMNFVRMVGVTKPDPNRSDMDYVVKFGSIGRPKGGSHLKGPFSTMTAVDMKTGTHAWHKGMPPGAWAFPLTTKTLLIGGQGGSLLSIDKATGDILKTLRLRDADGKSLGRISGAPMTYMLDGKQYIAMATSGGDLKARIIALKLP
jgi:quinoprotein glucose dehydrogenase